MKKFLQSKPKLFYVVITLAIVLLFTTLFNLISLKSLGEPYFTMIPIYLGLAGIVAVIGLSFTKYVNLSAGILACFAYAAFVLFAINIYKWPESQIMVYPIDQVIKFPEIVVCMALYIIVAIAANVCAWIKVKNKEASK